MSTDLTQPQATLEHILGVDVVVSRHMPEDAPDDGENARRIVRHRMRELSPWIKFDVGPKPYEATHAIYVAAGAGFYGGALMVSPQLRSQLHRGEEGMVEMLRHARQDYLSRMATLSVPVKIVNVR